MRGAASLRAPCRRRAGSAMVAGMGLEASSRLSQGETVLWCGRPRTAWYVVRLWWPAALPAAAVLVFGAGWEWLALRGHHLIVYPICGTLFLALGAYGVALRPLLLLRVARRMVYTVTDRRVMWEWGTRQGSTRAARRAVEFRMAGLPPWFLVPRRRGTDLVFFGEPPRDSSWGLWRLVELRPWFVCLDPETAADAAAALRARLSW